MAAAYHIGRGLTLLRADDDGVELEGTCRLAPGRAIVLFGTPPRPSVGRRVYVSRWSLVRAGSRGLFYRGGGEWVSGARHVASHGRPAAAP